MTDHQIELDGTIWRIIYFLDADDQIIDNPDEACGLLLQKPEEMRPDGVSQPFHAYRFEKGSLIKSLIN